MSTCRVCQDTGFMVSKTYRGLVQHPCSVCDNPFKKLVTILIPKADQVCAKLSEILLGDTYRWETLTAEAFVAKVLLNLHGGEDR